MKKTYFKPETTLHALYTEHGLMIKASEEGIDEAGSGDGPVVEDQNAETGEAWGDSHRRDYETSW